MNLEQTSRPDLDHRDWPVPTNRQEAFKQHGRLMRQGACPAFVSEGYTVVKELGIRGSSRPIPPGECAITSLAAGDGWVFGGTTGRRAHIFAYCSAPGTEEVVLDLTAFDEHTSIRNSLAYLPGHGLFAGTANPGCPGYAGGQVLAMNLWHGGDFIQEWGCGRIQPRLLGVPVATEGVACLIADPAAGRLYGLSDRTGVVFSVDAAGGEVRQYGPIDPLGRFSPLLILGPDGVVYGCGTAGRLMRLDVQAGTVQYAGLTLPSLAGRGQYFRLGAWAMDPRGGIIYAGDEADGVLMAIDVRGPSARLLGKPTAGPHVRALAVAEDGRVYGVAGQRDRIAHLFRCDPQRGELRDLGVLVAGTEKRWYGYEFDAAVAADGRIYLGESDRISHLFMYFPAGK